MPDAKTRALREFFNAKKRKLTRKFFRKDRWSKGMEINSAKIEEMVRKVLSGMQDCTKNSGSEVPVGVSNRHIHLSKADLWTLFGEGYELTPFKDLSLPPPFSSFSFSETSAYLPHSFSFTRINKTTFLHLQHPTTAGTSI